MGCGQGVAARFGVVAAVGHAVAVTRRLDPTLLAARLLPGGVPVVRRAVGRGLAAVFGPPPFALDARGGDAGLFGPGSTSWHLLADTASIVGGIRALLVQLLHPHAMAGVADHSEFHGDAVGRLRRTSAYVTTVAFGSTQEALAVTRKVREVHRRVQGVAPDGVDYRADDPHLLAWVSVALTASLLAADSAYAADPVTGPRADAFVAEQSRTAALLDPRVDLDALEGDAAALDALRRGDLTLPMIEEGYLPTSVAALHETVERYRPELGLNDQGRRGLKFLLWPPLPPPVRAGYLPVVAGAVATLADGDLALLGLPRNRLLRAAVRADVRLTVGLFRAVRGPSPVVTAAARRARGDG